MAEEKTDAAAPAAAPEPQPDEKAPGGKPAGPMPIVIAILVAVAAAAGGFFASRLMPQPAPAQAEQPPPEPMPLPALTAGDKFEYYDFDPITVNPDEPRRSRYVRAHVTLAIRKEDAEAAKKLLEEKKPELKSALIVYLAGCTLEDLGGRNIERVLRHIEEMVNSALWPGGRGLVHHVRWKDFYIQ